MHSNVTIKNVSWPHFSWPTLYAYEATATTEYLYTGSFMQKTAQYLGKLYK